MYFAATRSLANKPIRPWTLQLKNNSASKPQPSTIKYTFQPLSSRFHHENPYVVSTTRIGSLQFLPKPFLYSPSRTETTTSKYYMNGEIECPSYLGTPGCLPRDTDRAYFTQKEKDEIEKKIEEIIGESKVKSDINLNAYSLETLRRKIKSENLKDPDVPPGWEKKK